MSILLCALLAALICKANVNHDGSNTCDKTQCATCPFPCEEHNK